MRAIKPKDTKPELAVRQVLHKEGFRYRLHVRELPGRPDLVFPKYSSVVEVRGCFWHCHSCMAGRLPATNSTYWKEKLRRNVARDEENMRGLRALGYRVKVVWECELAPDRFARTIEKLVMWIRA